MTDPNPTKHELRRRAYAARRALPNKDELSRRAVATLVGLPEYQRARCVLWYVDCRGEVRTREHLSRELSGTKRLAVPYCTTDQQGQNLLRPWRLESLEELVSGKWNILEPPPARWHEPARQIEPDELDLVIVPGVAFDRQGRRLGAGQGYYDRLLETVRGDCLRIGLCFECQLLDGIEMQPHDKFMHRVVTESQVYQPP